MKLHIKEETVNIETENPGILEVPEGKNVEDLPIKHFVAIANKKGLSTVTRALNNLQVWNKNKNKPLSKWAGDMIDKVTKRFENQKKNESYIKEVIESKYSFDNLPKDAKLAFKQGNYVVSDVIERLFRKWYKKREIYNIIMTNLDILDLGNLDDESFIEDEIEQISHIF